jgi:hypothetical protein
MMRGYALHPADCPNVRFLRRRERDYEAQKAMPELHDDPKYATPPYHGRREEKLVSHYDGWFLWRYRDGTRSGYVITFSDGRVVTPGHHYYHTRREANLGMIRLIRGNDAA